MFERALARLLASLARHRLHEPRIALTVPGIIIMVPGMYAFQTIVLFDHGDMLAAIRAAPSWAASSWAR
jgi:uncharacterized membrane protein YjjB (DUF3815 family)